MAADVAELDRFADRLAEVDERGAAVAGAGIVVARRERRVVGQLHERRVLPERDRFRRRRHAADGAREQVAAKPTAATTTAAGGARRRDRDGPLSRTTPTATATGRFVD